MKNKKEHLKVPVAIDSKTTIYVYPEEVKEAKEKYIQKLKNSQSIYSVKLF